jgi:pimeloyl-ACP methyl ester carboxylesterase
MTFIDPVCFLLCSYDVAYNFLYKPATNAQEALMQWFVGRELYIAHTLSRRFWWHDNILWPEQLLCPTTVVLSSEDYIVPADAVRKHLSSWEARRKVREPDAPARIRVVWLEGVGHAGFILDPTKQQAIVQLIARPLD